MKKLKRLGMAIVCNAFPGAFGASVIVLGGMLLAKLDPESAPVAITIFGIAAPLPFIAFTIRDFIGWKCSSCGSSGARHEAGVRGLSGTSFCPTCNKNLE